MPVSLCLSLCACRPGLPSDPPSTFSYTKVFDSPGTVYYTSDSAGSKKGLMGSTMSGVITVLRDLKDPNAVSKCGSERADSE